MILLDTNVLSELMRPAPDTVVEHWLAGQPDASMFISAITEAELRYGAALLPNGKCRVALTAEIEGMLEEDFGGRVLPFDRLAAQAFAAIAADRRGAGRPISQADAQIAAIARSRRLAGHTQCVGFRRLRCRCDQPVEREVTAAERVDRPLSRDARPS